jgi:hypothetical protein
MRVNILLAIIIGLLIVGAAELSQAIADPEIYMPPSTPFYFYFAAIVLFTLLVIEQEQAGYFRELFKRIRSISLSQSLNAISRSPQPKMITKTKSIQSSSSISVKESRRIQKRIDQLEKENAELKTMYSEISVEIRKLKRKPK